MTTTTSKRCSRCKITKPLTDFHRDRTRRDGRRYDCKVCVRIAQADAEGGYRNGRLRFLREHGPIVDTLATVGKSLGLPPRRRTLPADLAVGRVVAVTDTLLAGLLAGDEMARAEAERILGGGR